MEPGHRTLKERRLERQRQREQQQLESERDLLSPARAARVADLLPREEPLDETEDEPEFAIVTVDEPTPLDPPVFGSYGVTAIGHDGAALGRPSSPALAPFDLTDFDRLVPAGQNHESYLMGINRDHIRLPRWLWRELLAPDNETFIAFSVSRTNPWTLLIQMAAPGESGAFAVRRNSPSVGGRLLMGLLADRGWDRGRYPVGSEIEIDGIRCWAVSRRANAVGADQ